MHILSKSTYIKGLQCEKALYMTKKHPYLRDKLSIEQRAKFQRGTDVGILAHQYFPGGVNMTPSSPTQFPKKVMETMQNLSNPSINAMYEAVFQYNDTLVMVDLLVRDGDLWRAIEVKSSMRLSPTYYNDAALQYYVLHGCGVPLSDFQLMYLNPDYVKQGPIDVRQLFQLVSVIDFAKEQEPIIAANVERLKNVVALPHAPQVAVGPHCHEPYPCDFLGHCWKNVPQKNDTDFTIDYKALFAQAPNPKPRSIAYLDLLHYYPAVPELDGTRPYQEMILAFALSGEHEPDGHTFWNCIEDHNRWQEYASILEEHIAAYDLIVCFTPTNPALGYKIFNLCEVLQNAQLFHPKIKAGYNLQNTAEALFHDLKLFEHSRILVEATSLELTSYEQVKNDLLTENEVIKRIYQHFFK